MTHSFQSNDPDSSVSQAGYASAKNQFLTALQLHGPELTYEDYADMFGVSRRQIKTWREELMDEMKSYLPKPLDRYAPIGYRRPKMNSKRAVLISSLATQTEGVTIPTYAILNMRYVEKNDEPGKPPYWGSQIILTYKGKIGTSRDTEADDDEIDDENDAISQQAAALSGDFTLP